MAFPYIGLTILIYVIYSLFQTVFFVLAITGADPEENAELKRHYKNKEERFLYNRLRKGTKMNKIGCIITSIVIYLSIPTWYLLKLICGIIYFLFHI